MGCASSINVQIEENKDNKKILANGKEVGNIKIYNNENIEEKSEDNQDEYYLEIPNKNENTESKTNTNTDKMPNKYNIKINDNYHNQSTNFKYLKDYKINLIKSNPVMNDKNIKKDEKYIPLKHPLDISSDNKSSQLKNLNKSEENEKINKEKNDNKNNNNDLINSIEERINNYHRINNNNEDEDDGVNMGNYEERDNDDMCNIGQSMDFDNIKNKENINNENECNKEICVIFEIQSTGVKYNININKDSKLIDLIELFKKKIKLSSFEKPEFVFNTAFLIDFEKPISDYKIYDNSKINVFI